MFSEEMENLKLVPRAGHQTHSWSSLNFILVLRNKKFTIVKKILGEITEAKRGRDFFFLFFFLEGTRLFSILSSECVCECILHI